MPDVGPGYQPHLGSLKEEPVLSAAEPLLQPLPPWFIWKAEVSAIRQRVPLMSVLKRGPAGLSCGVAPEFSCAWEVVEIVIKGRKVKHYQ